VSVAAGRPQNVGHGAVRSFEMKSLVKPKPAKKPRMTTREYLALPPDEHCHTELIYGEMMVVPKLKPKHNRAAFYLGQVVDRWVCHFKLGMMFFHSDMILDENKALVYAPNLLFLLKENENRYRDELIFGPVDLCVEILPSSERLFRQNRKYTDYERYGIPWYWIIDPNGAQPTLEEHQLVQGRFECRTEIVGDQWFEPGLFPGLIFRLPPLLKGDLKAAVKGKGKKLM
jgi:Uma2 family endonuclease